MRHVDVNPKSEGTTISARSPEKAAIQRAEKFALDPWTSSTFHVTGVAIAFVFALAMILNHPL